MRSMLKTKKKKNVINHEEICELSCGNINHEGEKMDRKNAR